MSKRIYIPATPIGSKAKVAQRTPAENENKRSALVSVQPMSRKKRLKMELKKRNKTKVPFFDAQHKVVFNQWLGFNYCRVCGVKKGIGSEFCKGKWGLRTNRYPELFEMARKARERQPSVR